jgi:hypothetical protein
MSKQDEYRQYANEAMESARLATSDAVRRQFLDLARMWMTAAQQLDDCMSIRHAPTTITARLTTSCRVTKA